MSEPVVAEAGSAAVLRRLLLLLAGVGVVGTAVELAFLRHWDSLEQLIPWVALAGLGLAVVAVAVRPSRPRVRGARVVAVLAATSGLYGMWSHAAANYDAGPLDQRYGATWATMGEASRWWEAVTGGVGPSPLLAPAALAQIGLCLLFATIAHPALQSVDPSA